MRNPVRTLLFAILLTFLFIPSLHASEMTVIITKTNTTECRVLEADALDQAIPDGWTRVDLTKEQCDKALPTLKADMSFDANIRAYIELLNCDKENNVKSLSYFGLGGKEVCQAAGLDYQSGRLVVGPVAPQKKQDKTPAFLAILAVLLVILILLILVKRKRRKNEFSHMAFR